MPEKYLHLIGELKKRTPATVTLTETRTVDDYAAGPYTDFIFVPQNPAAASLTISVTDDGAVDWRIDSLSRLEAHLGLKKMWRSYDYSALYDGHGGPTFQESSLIEQVHEAVALGRCTVIAGIAFGRLWGTGPGTLTLPAGDVPLRSVRGTGIARVFALFGKGELRTVTYSPW